jgi:DNA-binding winged helix-turn-helix (wHTH) protein
VRPASDDSTDEIAIFGRFQFEFSTLHLRKDGTRLRVEDKPARLLTALLRRAGRVVTREELQELLWPPGVHVDHDHGLNKSVNKLRFVLGDDPENPMFIETLPRVGYRFIGMVQFVAGGKPEPPNATPVAEADPLPNPAPDSFATKEDAAEPDSRPTVPINTTAPVSHGIERARWINGKAALALASVVLLIACVVWFAHHSAAKPHEATAASHISSIVIQKDGAIDPLDQGFKLHLPFTARYPQAVYNRETNGWDGWRVLTDDQNYYYRPLTGEEKDFALQHGWKVTCICALESGLGSVNVDFAGKGPRFDVQFLQRENRYFVALTKQISPKYEWEQEIEFAGVADVAHPHTYELRYDHATATASLWIDGKLKASGYHGHHQFQEDMGVVFGAAIYGTAPKSSLIVRRVRFEAY